MIELNPVADPIAKAREMLANPENLLQLALDRQREGAELQRLYEAVLAGMSDDEIEAHAGRQEDQAARYAANAYALRALIDVRRGGRQPTPRQHEPHEAFRRHLCCAANNETP